MFDTFTRIHTTYIYKCGRDSAYVSYNVCRAHICDIYIEATHLYICTATFFDIFLLHIFVSPFAMLAADLRV
jgi:hypothetical protein